MFDKNNFQMSNCCLDDIKEITSKHNLRIFNEKNYDCNAKYNCRDRKRCPLNGNCLIDNVIYKVTVRKEDTNNNSNSNDERLYIDTAEFNKKK